MLQLANDGSEPYQLKLHIDDETFVLTGRKFVVVSMDYEEQVDRPADLVLKTFDSLEIVFEFSERVNDPTAPMGGICIKTYTSRDFEQ